MTKDTMPDYDDVPPLEALDEADASAAFELDVPPDQMFDGHEDIQALDGALVPDDVPDDAPDDAPDGADEDWPAVVPVDAGDFAVETCLLYTSDAADD